jgi:nucleoside-diphosphate-sugar epimerase
VADLLITGATGFIGSHLVEALARRGIVARALVRATSDRSLLERFGMEWTIGDLGDPLALRRAVADVDTVVHLAAATRTLRATGFQEVNTAGTLRLIEAMEAGGGRRRMVYLSSLAAAGPSQGPSVGAEHEDRPLTTYGRSKLEGERVLLGRPGVEGVVLRPPAVYGPRDRDLLSFFKLARWGVLPVMGPAGRRVQMVHARDVAEALVQAMETPDVSGVYSIAEPVAYRWDEVLELVAAAVGRRGRRVRVPDALLHAAAGITQAVARATRRPATLDREKVLELLADGWVCDTEAARRDLGFVASIPLAEGLRETASWYRAHDWL